MYVLQCQHCKQRAQLPVDEFGREAVTDWFGQLHVDHLEDGENIVVIDLSES